MTALTCLVVGSGGREHALAWALARSPEVARVYVAPGNAGTVWPANPQATGWQPRAEASNVPIKAEDVNGLRDFALAQGIDLTVVGPEVALAAGLVDVFQAAGLRVFGPTQAAAQLESSKAFAKAFMVEHGIPTAAYARFSDFQAALNYARALPGPCVVKADGLAAGKGVLMCDSADDAEAALRQIMLEQAFGSAGAQVVIEERLEGREISALAFCDGQGYALMPLTRDHKRVFDGDHGPNTGGMGAYGPIPDGDEALRDTIGRTVIQPALDGMARRGTPFVGVLYAGLMQTADSLKVLEFNCRFGDPETQVVLPLLNDSLARILLACTDGRLAELMPCWREGVCVTVGLASANYPGVYPTGLAISGLEQQSPDVVVFHAGTTRREGQIVTAGGRVLSVSAWGVDLADAAERAYAHLPAIHFEGIHYRADIGGRRAGVVSDVMPSPPAPSQPSAWFAPPDPSGWNPAPPGGRGQTTLSPSSVGARRPQGEERQSGVEDRTSTVSVMPSPPAPLPQGEGGQSGVDNTISTLSAIGAGSGGNVSAYSRAGVNLAAGNLAVSKIAQVVRATQGPEVLAGVGAFGGLYDASALKGLAAPVLVASTDGVGTKTKVAARLGRWDSIGQDLVNHCINDILVQGARPLFFLDYVASARLDPDQIARIVGGVATACLEAGCALLGGETAEMPGVYEPGEIDLVGTIVGVADRANIIDGSRIQAGDVLLALPSSGLHTNGYSLARRVLEGLDWESQRPELGGSLGDALLAVHRPYSEPVRRLQAAGVDLRGLAHITGGGVIDNLPRILPEGVGAVIERGTWPEPPLFGLIQQTGDITDGEMFHVFNMGIGMLAVIPAAQREMALATLPGEAYAVGQIIHGDKTVTMR